MDRTVPAGAATLLNFIGDIEAPRGYDTIYGNNQSKLPKPITTMTVAEVLAAGPGWADRFGSSACGRYQFMAGRNHTLQGLKNELGLNGGQRFDADLQDRLAYHLLKRRGYEAYMAGAISGTEFGKRLAQEWASLPVLANTKGAHRQIVRGQSYYAGDGLNKSLVKPERVESLLSAIRAAPAPAPIPPPPDVPPIERLPENKPVAPGFAIGFGVLLVTAGGAALAKAFGLF